MKYIDLFAVADSMREGIIRAGFDSITHVERERKNTIILRL